ncbi:hypothetical protein [Geomicrobium sp. JCM 19038]|uniref:hypothetical protein n=1 Tax=Geomicrobium sp. JCM 19038 TaxID=1460635 RepID=UPI00045F3986|nr:hypothetical protein [Geomicrobium sp. JCM 19038]GAK09025.1 hypothetical protein JCM19038_2836 [Geomicrobium sp. JCM 19038]
MSNKWVKITTTVVGVLVIGTGAFLFGQTGANTVIGEERYNYDELSVLKGELEEKIDKYEQRNERLIERRQNLHRDLRDINTDIENAQNDMSELLEMQDNKEQIEKDYDSMQSDLEDLSKDLSKTEELLAKTQGDLKKAEKEPITLSAGTYIVGTDIDPGRYLSSPIGRSGNFSSHDTNDRLTSLLR